MTELDIINAMLAAVGSNGVTSTIGRHPALIKAKPILTRVNKQVQNAGHWFNTDVGLTLAPSTDGEFIVPQTTLRCDCTNKRLPYVRRGRRMYNPQTQTYTLDIDSLDVDCVIELDYEFLPFVAWDMIRARAVWQMLINAEADQITLQAASEDKRDTETEFQRERRQQNDTTMRDNPEYAYIMGGMPDRYSRGTNPNNIGG